MCGTPSSPDKVSTGNPTVTTLKVHLPNGTFNIVKYGEAIDIKVCKTTVLRIHYKWCLAATNDLFIEMLEKGFEKSLKSIPFWSKKINSFIEKNGPKNFDKDLGQK